LTSLQKFRFDIPGSQLAQLLQKEEHGPGVEPAILKIKVYDQDLIGSDDFLGQLELDLVVAVAKGLGKVITAEYDLQPKGSGVGRPGAPKSRSFYGALKAGLGGAQKTAPDAPVPVKGYDVATRGKIKLSFALHTRASQAKRTKSLLKMDTKRSA
jgi:hypothetical protein